MENKSPFKKNKPQLSFSNWFDILSIVLISVGWLYLFIFLPARTLNRWFSKEEPAETQIVQEISQEQLMEDKEKIKNFSKEVADIDNEATITWRRTLKSTAIGYELYQELKFAQNMMRFYDDKIDSVEIPDLGNDVDEKALKDIVSSLGIAYSSGSLYFDYLAKSLDAKDYQTKQSNEEAALFSGLEVKNYTSKATTKLVEIMNKYNLMDEEYFKNIGAFDERLKEENLE